MIIFAGEKVEMKFELSIEDNCLSSLSFLSFLFSLLLLLVSPFVPGPSTALAVCSKKHWS